MIGYSLARTVDPTVEPITPAEAKKHCEISPNDATHDAFLDALVATAREQVEHDTGTALIDQTWTLSLESFPARITIPLRPVQSITSITYYDTDNAQQTLSTDVYGLDVPRGVVHLKYDQEWPSITEQHNGIEITLVAGYGSSGDDVPGLIKQPMLLQIGKWFVERDMLDSGDISRYAYDAAYDRLINRQLRTGYP